MSHFLKSRLASAALAGLLATSSVAALAPAAFASPVGGYGDLVAKLSPSVVYIEVEEKGQPGAQMQLPPGFPKDELEKRFGPIFPDNGPDQPPMRALGTGFVYFKDGMIVTNNHVVDGATKITVKLGDGRSFEAKVKGADPLTDIALLQIEGAGDLPAVTMGDSDKARVGDDVLAIGNPFGLGETVTSGIVSAVKRDIHSGPYDDYIQTDAAINRGNSGGPLFNDKGEVIGMNTAIFSQSGGSVGIGFAVPADLIAKVATDLARDGSITRGWLGVAIGPMSKEVADVLGYAEPKGAVVQSVQPDSPAAKAGLQSNDIITKVKDQEITDPQALQRAIADQDPSTKTALTVLRKGKEMTVDVTVGKLPSKQT